MRYETPKCVTKTNQPLSMFFINSNLKVRFHSKINKWKQIDKRKALFKRLFPVFRPITRLKYIPVQENLNNYLAIIILT